MKGPADIYRAEILRAVFGERANEAKVHDPARLSRVVENLVDCEDAKSILRAKGYGRAGASFVELAREVPNNVRQMLKNLFRPTSLARVSSEDAPYPDLNEVLDIWTAR